MLGITMNYDISSRMTPQSSTITCHHMKQFIKNKNKEKEQKHRRTKSNSCSKNKNKNCLSEN